MTAFFRFRKILPTSRSFDLAFWNNLSGETDSGIKDRRCQTVRISVILISYGNISKIIGKNSFPEQAGAIPPNARTPTRTSGIFTLYFSLPLYFGDLIRMIRRIRTAIPKDDCTYGHLGNRSDIFAILRPSRIQIPPVL